MGRKHAIRDVEEAFCTLLLLVCRGRAENLVSVSPIGVVLSSFFFFPRLIVCVLRQGDNWQWPGVTVRVEVRSTGLATRSSPADDPGFREEGVRGSGLW